MPKWIYGLSINDRSNQNWLNIQKILNTHFPDIIERIEPALFSNDHTYWAALRESLDSLKSAIELNPRYIKAYYYTAKIHNKTGKYDLAV